MKPIAIARRLAGTASPRKRIAGSVLAAALATGGGFALSTVPATAAPAPGVTAVYQNGQATTGPCIAIHTIHLRTNMLVHYLSNGCMWRVWLHETNWNAGANTCISPYDPYQGVKPATYANMWVSGNSTPCP